MSLHASVYTADLRARLIDGQFNDDKPSITIDGIDIYIGHWGKATRDDLREESEAFTKLAQVATEASDWCLDRAGDAALFTRADLVKGIRGSIAAAKEARDAGSNDAEIEHLWDAIDMLLDYTHLREPS